MADEDPRTGAARTHFDRWSRSYERDRSSRKLGEIQRRALARLELGDDDIFLDVGCGTGAAVREAAGSVARAVGLDLSPGMIAQARERAAGLANAEFVEGDAGAGLPFADGEFSAVLCTTAFHHFTSQREAIGEIARVLAPEGRVVIADGNPLHPGVFLLDRVLRVAQPSHVGLRSPRWLARRLRRCGLRAVSIETIWRGAFALTSARKPAPRGIARLGRRRS